MMPNTNKPILMLNDMNWNSWRIYFRGRLLSKGLNHVMTKHYDKMTSVERNKLASETLALVAGGNGKTYAEYITDDQKALGYLIESIQSDQYQYIENYDST